MKTMTDRRDLTETELDALFDAARDTAPAPSTDLMARIMADADAVTEAEAQARAADRPASRNGGLRRLLAAIGGWPSVAGLAAAGVFGVAIGLTAPAAIDTASGGLIAAPAYDVADFGRGYGMLAEEG